MCKDQTWRKEQLFIHKFMAKQQALHKTRLLACRLMLIQHNTTALLLLVASLQTSQETTRSMVIPTVKPTIFDGETNRPMTDNEYAQWQADNAENEAQAVAQAEALAAKDAARQAVLDKLGLTADEAAALFG